MKSIYETLAALGAGAILLTGCGATNAPAKTVDVPAATETTPVAEGPETEAMTGDAAAAAGTTGNDAAMPAAATSASPAATPTAMTSATAAAAKKAAPAKTGTTGKKKDAAGSCGEGTCG